MARMTVKNQGELLQFLSAGDANISSCKVYFSPKQSGEGTPSPENVRPIEGWSGVEVTHCGKNLFSTNHNNYSHPSTNYKASFEPEDMIFQDGELSGTVETDWRDTCVFSQNKPFLPGTYTLSFDYINGLGNYSWRPLLITKTYSGWYTSYKGVKAAANDSGHITTTFTADEPFYISMCLNSFGNATKTAVNKIYNIQLSQGSEEINFEPYQSRAEKELPSEYQRVEYIESTGTQYFWTDINVQDGLTVESASTYSPFQDSYLFGGAASAANDRVCFNGVYSGNLQCAYPSGWFYAGTIQQDGKTIERITTTLSNNKVTIYKNGDLVTQTRSGTLPKETGAKCVCFGYRNSQGNVACFYKGKVYELRIKKDTDMLANFIPCLRRADSKPGMYDTVSQTFYTNQGTGEFIAGPAVNRYEIDWSEDLGTIYGGYVDLVNGELVETWDNIEISKFGQISKSSSTNEPWVHRFTLKNWNSDIKAYDKVSGVSNMICDICATDDAKQNYEVQGVSNTIDIYLYDDTISTVDEFKEKYANHYIAYPIKEAAYTYHQLSPAILTTLTGNNTFWSNADYIEIEYDLIETQEIMDVRKRIIGSFPHLETAGGQFSTDMAAPLKSCRISFSPIQEGEGDPSPSNVRPIKGWDGITVKRCGKNLYPYSQGSTAAYQPIFLKVNTEYVFSCNTETAPYVRVRYVDGTVSPIIWLRNDINGIKYASFTPALDADGAFIFRGDGLTNPMIELGSVPTEYEPYTETSITIPFPQTIYGGYVDLVKGEIVEEWKEYVYPNKTNVFNDLGNGYYEVEFPYVNGKGYGSASNSMCSKLSYGYKTSTLKIGYELDYVLSKQSNRFHTVVHSETPLTADTARQWFIDNNIQLVREVYSPTVYPLTPQTIKALKGINNVFSDANGSVELTYWTH